MNRRAALAVALLLLPALASPQTPAAKPPEPITVLKAARIFDGAGDSVARTAS